MLFGCKRAQEGFFVERHSRLSENRETGRECLKMKARTSMVDGFPYKEEVGGSSPSVPTIQRKRAGGTDILVCDPGV
jgi:hypothetical protein